MRRLLRAQPVAALRLAEVVGRESGQRALQFACKRLQRPFVAVDQFEFDLADRFAAGFLAGQAEGRSLAESLTMGAVCAREIIAQVGPRAQTDLKAKVATRLG